MVDESDFENLVWEFVSSRKWVGLSDLTARFKGSRGSRDYLVMLMDRWTREGKLYLPIGGGWAIVQIQKVL